jgi:WD40 repeat protein
VTGAVRHTLTHSGVLRCLLARDGKRLATITFATVQLWDTETGGSVGEPIVVDSKRHDACATFDASGQRLAVWWSEPELPGHVRIIAAATGLDIQPPFQHPSVVTDAAFSPAGDLLVTASGDQRLWLWRLGDGRPALAPILHDHAMNDVGFFPDGSQFWSRVGRQLYTWETATGDAVGPVLQHRGPPRPAPGRQATGAVVTRDDEKVHVAWSADHRLTTCDSRGGVNLWDFTAGTRPLDVLEALARVLSSHRIDPSGGLVPLSREELRAAWAAVHH